MRILLNFPYALGRVGVGRTALEQVEGLRDRGHDVLVSAPLLAPGLPSPVGVKILETRRVAGSLIPSRMLRTAALRLALHDRRTMAWLRRENRSAPIDVLHSWPLSGVRTMREARSLGVTVLREAPNTHTAHAYDVVEREAASLGLHIPVGNSHHRDPAHLRAEELEWALANVILAPSDAVAESFREQGFSADRVLRHRYGCTLGEQVAERADGPLRVLFLGAAEPRKGLHHGLEAWRRSIASREGTLQIAGTFMPGYREAIHDLLDSPSVCVLGFVAEPAALLARADVLLLPSVEEGSAIVTYEAQAAGCIPLVSRAAGAHLEPGVHGFVHETGDVAELTRQLDRLATDPGQRRRMREACTADRSRLGWDAAALALEQAYLTAAGRNRVHA
ncbi:glycosyltransferase family 4 protein [Microbacterium sp. NPDC056234]|uniref:glycosyltransferase family 4 protein n=1 Tax=Microbacterium sp. NPDC056234 TaxID=3345757 RepID=UPI0035DB0A76